ncbi:hypothetical protein K8R03_03360 [Candidatus Kaiserbacteria bacterium]|nr:hypothetical protein [Candidatus Kaiserbacteria bacterium]
MKKQPGKPKFNFEQLKAAAASTDIEVRAKAFAEYFEMFNEFPSYLYDNTHGIDAVLLKTVEKMKSDPETNEKVRAGIESLLNRLPSSQIS